MIDNDVNSNLNKKSTVTIGTLTPSENYTLAANETRIVNIAFPKPSKSGVLGLWINIDNSNIRAVVRNVGSSSVNIFLTNMTSTNQAVTAQVVVNYMVLS